ncbi:MAG: SAF domain-containing protein [Brachybacterium sp.]|nr:SAF domain-containing protein [Brachybacterium sp.]
MPPSHARPTPPVRTPFSQGRLAAWRRAVRRRRRPLALLGILALLTASIPALISTAPPTVPVLVASGDLKAGHALTSADLTHVEIAEDLVPPAAHDPGEDADGRVLAAAVPEGAVLMSGHLSPDGTPARDGTRSAVLIPVAAPLAAHLAPGSLVDVITRTPENPGSVTVRAEVLTIEESGTDQPAFAGNGVAGTVPVMVLVEPARASDIADATFAGSVFLALRG